MIVNVLGREHTMSTGTAVATRGNTRAMSRVLPILLATAATVAAWVVAHHVLHLTMTAKLGKSLLPVTLIPVVSTTIIAGVLCSVVVAAVKKRRTFTVLAIIGYLGSLAGPLSATTNSGKLALIVMHTLVALILIPGIGRTARER